LYNRFDNRLYRVNGALLSGSVYRWFIVDVTGRESEDTVLMILKEIYSVMGVAAQKSTSDAESAQQPAHLPAHAVHPSLPAFRPPAAPVPQFTNGSSNSGTVPMFAAPPQLSSSAISGPPLATAPGTTYLDYSPHPTAMSAGQSPAVGPPPKSGFVRK